MRKVVILWLTILVIYPQLLRAKANQDNLNEKQVVLIIAQVFWHSNEYDYLKELFERHGVKITSASASLNENSRAGITVKPDLLIKDIEVQKYDAIIFIGGAGILQYSGDYFTNDLIKKAAASNTLLGGLQVAPYLFDEAGILNGKKVTAFNSYNISTPGAIITDNLVERDGNIITASEGPGVLEKFGKVFIEALGE